MRDPRPSANVSGVVGESERGGGPRVVALGGGHGLAATLAAVRSYSGDITAIVSVADDGGSSGRLRAAFGGPAPGDVRRCLVALADPSSLWTTAFEHRFGAGEMEGHAFGNLVIVGLAQVLGDFPAALAEAGRLLGAVGAVIPATREPVSLRALVRAPDGQGPVAVEGQVAVGQTAGIAGVFLVPDEPDPPAEALAALAAADQVVLGPGSLFTSVLAVTAVPAIRQALASTPGRRVYVCNLRPQQPETAGLTDVAGHVAALAAHGVEVDVVLCHPGALPVGNLSVPCVERPVADDSGSVHDPLRLAAALQDLVG